jgi:peptidoglycan/LPS O-acetylase OafA/YrhL
MILATLSWICFERPILRLKKRFSSGSDKSQPPKLMVELPNVAAAEGA